MDTPIKCVKVEAFLNLFKVIAKNAKQTNLKKPKSMIRTLLLRRAPTMGLTKNKFQKSSSKKIKSKKLNRKI